MKKIFYFLSVAALVIIAASCDKAKTTTSGTTPSDSIATHASSSAPIDSIAVKPK